MIDAKLLQSFISDIERLRSNSSSSANGLTSSAGAKSAPYDPFAEVLAKTIEAFKADQSQGDIFVSGTTNYGLQLGDLLSARMKEGIEPSSINYGLQVIGTDMFNKWLNQGNNRGASVTTEDIDTLFPELPNLNPLISSK